MNNRIALVALFALTLAQPAFAHAFLKQANPSAGQTLAAPKEISLSFSEKLEPSLSGVTVTDSAGHDVGAKNVVVEDDAITVTLPALKPGAYHVAWHALSVDSHRTEGSYTFNVQP